MTRRIEAVSVMMSPQTTEILRVDHVCVRCYTVILSFKLNKRKLTLRIGQVLRFHWVR